MTDLFLNGRVELHCGDCLDVLATLPECSVDSVVTDPPYHLTSIVKRFGANGAAPAQYGKDGAYARASAGFMGKVWDGGDIAFKPETWAAVLRVLKPGGHLLAFGGTRTFARMSVAIEDAGFEIRDTLAFVYGCGFPKSHSINKAIGNAACSCLRETISERDLRPVSNANVLAPIDAGEECGEVLQSRMSQHGTPITGRAQSPGNERAAQSSLERRSDISEAPRQLRERSLREMSAGFDLDGASGRLCDGAPLGDGAANQAAIGADGMRSPSRPSTVEQHGKQSGTMAVQPQPQKRGAWSRCGRCGKPIIPDELGTALKPAMELIVLARKPLSEATVAANVLRWGTGAINVGACRVATKETYSYARKGGSPIHGGGENVDVPAQNHPLGRWPANVIHDGSAEVVGAFPDAPGQQRYTGPEYGDKLSVNVYGDYGPINAAEPRGDSGSAARFYYSAKADADDRLGSKHPTVKPVDLMQYLVRLVTPPGGVCLDPFAGTGTTGEAAWREGMRAILIEAEPEYQADVRRRMELALAGPDEKAHAIVKAKGLTETPGPLFDWGGEYNAHRDVEGSFSEAYRTIRERKAAGGPGWEPK